MTKKRGRPRKPVVEEKKTKRPQTVPITGEWTEIEAAQCQRCSVVRRLYSPLMLLTLKVCAPCSQICATSSLPALDEDEEEDVDNVWVRSMLSDLTDPTK